MIPNINHSLFNTLGISDSVDLQIQRKIKIRLAVVLDYLHRAKILLDMLLEADAKCNGQTYANQLPKMSALAHGVVDHMHIASKLTMSLSDLSAYDLEYPSGKNLSGPHKLEKLNPDLWASIKAACTTLQNSTQDLKGIRDTAHHADERINGKASRKDLIVPNGINIGCFVRRPILAIQSTAVLEGPHERTSTSVPTYLAQVELSTPALKRHAQEIGKVFLLFGWDGQLPEPIRA